MTATRAESHGRSLLVACAIATLVGIALSTGETQELGAWITLAGLIGLIFSVHRFGRLGPEPPLDLGGDRRSRG